MGFWANEDITIKKLKRMVEDLESLASNETYLEYVEKWKEIGKFCMERYRELR